jgi:small subunit ribosomal protein S27Ae
MIMSEEGTAPPKEKTAKRREKRQRTGRKHESLHVWEYYEVKGDGVERKRKPCPRCGPGTMLSEHGNRRYCGRCGYTEFGGKASGQPKGDEEKPTEEPAEEEKKE